MKLRITILLATCFLFISTIQAANIEWWFTNSNQNWLPTDTIVVQATLRNTDTTILELGNLDSAVNGGMMGYGTFPAIYFDGGYAYVPGTYEFIIQINDVLIPDSYTVLQPGETIDFVFGEFVPVESIAPGIYQMNMAQLSSSMNSQYSDYFDSNNLFSATIVPLPPAFLLMGSGVLGLFAMARRNTSQSSRFRVASSK